MTREVPRNICVLLIRCHERDEGSLLVDYFSLQHSPHTHTSFSQAVVGERQAWVFGLGRESAMKTFLVAIITGGSLLHHVVGLFHVARLGFLYWF